MRFDFGRLSRRSPRDAPRADAAEGVKALVRTALGLDEDTAVTVTELGCPDPACPTFETVVLVMEPGQKTRAFKIHADLADIDAAAVRTALAQDAGESASNGPQPGRSAASGGGRAG